jgi:hypothetical protein
MDPAPPVPTKGESTPEPDAFQTVLKEIAINPEFSPDQWEQVLAAVADFPMIFAHSSHRLGKCPNNEMVIEEFLDRLERKGTKPEVYRELVRSASLSNFDHI